MRISIEPIHIYGLWGRPSRRDGDSRDEGESYVSELVRTHLRRALPYVQLLVETLSDRYDGSDFSFAVMLDDYSLPGEVSGNGQTVADVSRIVDAIWREEIAESALEDYQELMIVSEASLATAQITKDVLARICIAAPEPGAGSTMLNRRLGARSSSRPHRTVRSDTIVKPDSATIYPTLGESTRHPDIDIECSLYSDEYQERPSCALLAASWQLFRMNWSSAKLDSDTVILSGSFHPCSLSWSVLPVSLISVEHAVRTILCHLVEPLDDVLSRMCYVFLADGLEITEAIA